MKQPKRNKEASNVNGFCDINIKYKEIDTYFISANHFIKNKYIKFKGYFVNDMHRPANTINKYISYTIWEEMSLVPYRFLWFTKELIIVHDGQ